VLFGREHQILDEEKDLFAWAVILDLRVGLLHLAVVEALHQLKGVGIVVVHSEVPHALNWDASLALDDLSNLMVPVAFLHDEADALLPQSEEGETHQEVDGLDEAFVSQEVLVGAGGEEDLVGVAKFGLQNGCGHIEAELLILGLVIDKAFFVMGWVLVDLLHILITHAAKRGTDKFRGLLETERNEDPFYLWVLRDVVLESADDLHLLRLLEGLPAIVHGNTNELLGLREVEVQPQVEPFLLNLFIALLPVFIRDELRCNVRVR
jgi:hypothetical protein